MGYVSLEQAQEMEHEDLVTEFIETQTMAASAISVALELGGHKAESLMLERYYKRLPRELRTE